MSTPPTPTSASWLKPHPSGVTVALHIQPNAKRSEVIGVQGEALKVKIAAPPVDGVATEALLDFLAATLGIKRRAVVLLRGAASRQKVVLLQDVGVERALGAFLTAQKPP